MNDGHGFIDFPHSTRTFTPSGAWSQDSECHYLIVEIPEFKVKDISVNADEHGNLIIKGGRLTRENNYIKFEKQFKLPEDADLSNDLPWKIQYDMLYVTVPKRVGDENMSSWDFEGASKPDESKGQMRESESKSSSSKEDDHDERKHDEKDDVLKPQEKGEVKEDLKEEMKEEVRVMSKYEQHKGILWGLLAFALGVLVGSLRKPPSSS